MKRKFILLIGLLLLVAVIWLTTTFGLQSRNLSLENSSQVSIIDINTTALSPNFNLSPYI